MTSAELTNVKMLMLQGAQAGINDLVAKMDKEIADAVAREKLEAEIHAKPDSGSSPAGGGT